MGNELKKPWLSTSLAEMLNLEHRGKPVQITQISSIDNPQRGAIMFMKNSMRDVNCHDVVVVAPPTAIVDNSSAHLASEQPRLDFMKALCIIKEQVGFVESVIPAVIHPTAQVSEYASVANDVCIGAGTVIEPHVSIHPGTQIGSNCLIRSGADIGGEGFGYERLEDGTPLKFVHLGGVRIGDCVEIGANTCVSRGTISDTVIDDYAKIDNLVHIAHNCHIGRAAFVIAGAEISGGVQIGSRAWIGPNAAIIQQVKIGAGATIGLGAVVTKDVPDGQTFAGSPAQEISEFIRHRKAIAGLQTPKS